MFAASLKNARIFEGTKIFHLYFLALHPIIRPLLLIPAIKHTFK